MPIYEFLCPNKHRFDHLYARFEDAPAEITCMACGEPAPRIISMTSFALKGADWATPVDKPAFSGIKKLEDSDGINKYHYDKERRGKRSKSFMET